jgi:hypothetical protein
MKMITKQPKGLLKKIRGLYIPSGYSEMSARHKTRFLVDAMMGRVDHTKHYQRRKFDGINWDEVYDICGTIIAEVSRMLLHTEAHVVVVRVNNLGTVRLTAHSRGDADTVGSVHRKTNLEYNEEHGYDKYHHIATIGYVYNENNVNFFVEPTVLWDNIGDLRDAIDDYEHDAEVQRERNLLKGAREDLAKHERLLGQYTDDTWWAERKKERIEQTKDAIVKATIEIGKSLKKFDELGIEEGDES